MFQPAGSQVAAPVLLDPLANGDFTEVPARLLALEPLVAIFFALAVLVDAALLHDGALLPGLWRRPRLHPSYSSRCRRPPTTQERRTARWCAGNSRRPSGSNQTDHSSSVPSEGRSSKRLRPPRA